MYYIKSFKHFRHPQSMLKSILIAATVCSEMAVKRNQRECFSLKHKCSHQRKSARTGRTTSTEHESSTLYANAARTFIWLFGRTNRPRNK